jgi:hypothetical protein
MKRISIILIILVSSGICFGQNVTQKKNLTIQKSNPALFLDNPYTHSGAVLDFSAGDIRLTQTNNTLTFTGGNYLFTGSVGATGTRITKGWFTDLEITNAPTVNGTSIITTIGGKVNITDTAAMLTDYINKADTASMLNKYFRTLDAEEGLGLKVDVADTAAMLTNYINKADTATMLTKYARKLNPVFTGAVTLPSGDTTVTAVKGKMIFKTSDSTMYVCRSTTFRHKWFSMLAP